MAKAFNALQAALARQGAANPGALAATIGRKKLGKSRFQALATAGRKRKRAESPAVEAAGG